jgi:Aerobic-type carbon monoxide dehydrogenase, large subunit CoxL/CutL homologs
MASCASPAPTARSASPTSQNAGHRSLEAECERDLRAGRRHLSERHPSRRSRDRSRHRHHQDRQLRHRRRFRRDAQSAAARRPGAWRRDAGIGQALMEQAVYSATDGQLVTGTFMDYALPRAADGPSFHFETHNVPCTTNPLGVKGAGEAGRSAPVPRWSMRSSRGCGASTRSITSTCRLPPSGSGSRSARHRSSIISDILSHAE